jgi:hypothetical protein
MIKTTNYKSFLSLVIISFLLSFSMPAMAGKWDSVLNKALTPQKSHQKPSKTHAKTKISPHLSKIVQKKLNKKGIQFTTTESTQTISSAHLSTKQIHIDDENRVQLKITLNAINHENLSQLEEIDAKIDHISKARKQVQLWIPYDQITELEALDFVTKIKKPSYGITKQGDVMSEADELMFTDDVREDYGYTGAGIRIGVISDGVAGLFDSVDSGDIPSGDDDSCDDDGEETSAVHCKIYANDGADNGPEGTAMLELIYDIAPDVELYFANLDTTDDFIDAVNYLAYSANVDIIVDDIGFYEEGYFIDTDVAETVEAVIEDGYHFVTAAGNDAEQHVQEEYEDNDDDGYHDFRDELNTYTTALAEGETMTAVLQWDDKDWDEADNNLDLFADIYLYDDDDGCYDLQGTYSKTEDNVADKDSPMVSMEITAEVDICVLFYIAKEDGDGDDVEFELFTFNSNYNEYSVEEDTIKGHASVKDAITVSAVNADNAGLDDVADYCSQGPVTLANSSRDKPDVTGIDGVSVTGNGGYDTTFYGTSAAAPHVAACVALMLEANDELSPDDVKDILEDTATDIESSGFDDLSGHGLIDCKEAVEEAEDYDGSGGDKTDKNDPGDSNGDDDDDDDDSDNSESAANSATGCSLLSNTTPLSTRYLWILLLLPLITLRLKQD